MNERKKERKKERERERDFGLRMMMGRGKYDVIKHFLGQKSFFKNCPFPGPGIHLNDNLTDAKSD